MSVSEGKTPPPVVSVSLCSPQRLLADAGTSSVKQEVPCPAPQNTEEEKDEESQFSEGQLISTGCQSDDSDLSEETVEGEH